MVQNTKLGSRVVCCWPARVTGAEVAYASRHRAPVGRCDKRAVTSSLRQLQRLWEDVEG